MIKMKAFSVSEINKYIKRILGTDPIVNNVLVEGEISNFTSHSSGHAYFTLKDEQSKITCVMFANDLATVNPLPKTGDKVQIKGQISVFERDGRYQLYAKQIEFVGKGALYLEFEQLKKTLAAQGYFDEANKKPIPKFPKRIAVITSPTGAALQDVISVAHRRGCMAELIVIPALVQGEQAPRTLIEGIERANAIKGVDLILLARGGGSIEELWGFNDLGVAKAIRLSKCPIISGVGHETDFTIADFVADKRAATPTAAAEIAIIAKADLLNHVNKMMQSMVVGFQKQLTVNRMKINELGVRYMKNVLDGDVQRKENTLDRMRVQMQQCLERKVSKGDADLQMAGENLSKVNPMAILLRGYSLVYKEDHLVQSIEPIEKGDALTIRTHDGQLDVTVTDKVYLT